ncbi:MAG: hypothetical protein H7326_07735 [Bdellovibrionaceae bacterium]|nr:hypothetical protein [Pseudobdellovibrionaceae bacterium]
MKQLQALIIVALVVAIFFAGKYLSEIESALPEAVPANQIAVVGVPSSQVTPASNPAHAKDFSDLIRKEAESMSHLTDRPDEVQKRLKDLAAQVREEQVPILKEKALNIQLGGDERFLSVYILGESSLAKAQESLELIASTPIPKLKESRLTTQEEVLRGQAIESLREPESLKRVLSSADNKFLVDRAQRTLSFREGKVSASPEQQDQEALKKVLEKSTQ